MVGFPRLVILITNSMRNITTEAVSLVCILATNLTSGTMCGVSADLLGLPDAEHFIGCDLAPPPPAPGTKRSMACASWSPWGPPTGSYGASEDSLGLPDTEYFIGWDLANPPLAQGTKRGRPSASWIPWGHLIQGYKGYHQICWDSQMQILYWLG